jgi:hypothetical protein
MTRYTLEGEVQCLGREVTDDVGRVTTPEGENALLPRGTGKTFNDTVVAFS